MGFSALGRVTAILTVNFIPLQSSIEDRYQKHIHPIIHRQRVIVVLVQYIENDRLDFMYGAGGMILLAPCAKTQ